MRPIAAVDHRAWDMSGQEVRGTGSWVTDDDDICGHGRQRQRRVLQAFPLSRTAAAAGNIDDISTEPFASDLEGRPCTCAWLVEEVDDRLPSQRRNFLDFSRGHLEERLGRI